MINCSNGMMSTSSSSSAAGAGGNAQSSGLKTYFKTPEGRYKLHYEKGHPSSVMHYVQGKTVTQATVAIVKDKASPPTPPSQPSSGFSASSGVKLAAAKLLGGSNGNRTFGFVGGNGGSKSHSVSSKLGPFGSNSTNSNPTSNFDVYSMSLEQQLQDSGKKLVGAQHYNKDGSVNNSRCTCISWMPGGDGAFVVAHADGNMYVYEKGKEGAGDSSFPVVKDPTQFSIAHARHSKSNPITRWHTCQGSINGIGFSSDGTHLATVGRDGYLRVFDYSKEELICGGKSYYGAILCCAWSADGKYILAGGEDDLVQIWSMDDKKVVAWGEGHNSWVSGVAFDSSWSPPDTENTEQTVYRFGSVGQDTQLLLWDLQMEEIVVPQRRPPGGSLSVSSGSQTAQWDNARPSGTLQPAPSMRDIPKISPLVTHRVHTEPLSGLIFTEESILTVCREGHIKVWMRPGNPASQGSSNSETPLSTSLKDKSLLSSKVSGSSGYRQ